MNSSAEQMRLLSKSFFPFFKYCIAKFNLLVSPRVATKYFTCYHFIVNVFVVFRRRKVKPCMSLQEYISLYVAM